jgi:recombination protein RecT
MANIVKKDQIKKVQDLLDRAKPAILAALPRHMSVDRMMRVALTQIRKNPVLLECDAISLIGAVVQAAQLGLEIGVQGQAYLVPYGKEVQLIPGYRGLTMLARRTGEVESIPAYVVHSKDEFDISLGTDPKITHNPKFSADNKQVIGAYAVAIFTSGFKQFEYMPIEDLEAIRARSKAKNNGPWVTDTEEMYRKTVVRRISKFVPSSVELARAVELDNKAEAGESQNLADIIDIQALPAEDRPAPEPSPIEKATQQLKGSGDEPSLEEQEEIKLREMREAERERQAMKR